MRHKSRENKRGDIVEAIGKKRGRPAGSKNKSKSKKALSTKKALELEMSPKVAAILQKKGGGSVPIDMDFGHFPLFSCTKHRNGGEIVKRFPGGWWVLSGVEHPNLADLDVYLAVLKLFELAEVEGRLITIGEVDRIVVAGDHLLEMLNLSRCSKNRERVIHSLQVLHRFSAERYCSFERENKKEMYLAEKERRQYTPRPTKVMRSLRLLDLPGYDIKAGQATIVIDIKRHLRLGLESEQLKVHWHKLQSLNSVYEKGVFLYYECNSWRWIRQDWLYRFLDIQTPPTKPLETSDEAVAAYEQEVRTYTKYLYGIGREVKDALVELGKKGYIRKFDPKAHIIERSGKTLYLVQKPTSASEAKKEAKAALLAKYAKPQLPAPAPASMFIGPPDYSDIPL